jgi:hypothetical protein
LRRIISFTIVQDEPFFEYLWRDYYSKVGDVVVFDPRITPGLPKELGSVEAEVQQCMFVYNTTKYFLSVGYDVVLCPDVDEFLIPSNGQGNFHGYRSLKEFCNIFTEDYIKANGYTVVHQRNSELSANQLNPLCDRSVCYKSSGYCKTIITRVPLIYGRGRHTVYREDGSQINTVTCKDLDLLHLKFIDFNRDYSRWIERSQRSPNMYRFTPEEFGKLYDNGIEDFYKFRYWEGEALPLKPHWRDIMKINNCFEGIVCRDQIPGILLTMNAKRICEVGVKNGDHLANLMVPSVKQAVAVDMWKETGIRSQNDECCSIAEFEAQYEAVKVLDSRIIIDRCSSVEAASHYSDGFFDFVYIDADHTEAAVREDLKAWWPKVRLGGILAGHDYVQVSPTCKDGEVLRFGVVEAVNWFVNDNRLSLYIDQDTDWFILKQ